MAFNIPINSIAPYPTPADWVRPTDWISITDVADEVQFLVADTGLKAFAIQTTFTKNSGTNIYIDWGDGVIDTISTATLVTTNHVYSTGGTPCSRGYNTFKIRIYGDATCVITNVKHVANFAVTGGNPLYNVGVLEAYFGDGTMNDIAASLFSSFAGTGSVATFTELEFVKLPSTVTWTGAMASMFQNCFNLYVVIMPTSASSLTTLALAFSGCGNLLDIILPSNATGITSLATAFNACRSLRTISFPISLNSCTTFNSAFQNCYSLKNATLPSINLATDFSNAFLSNISLQWFKFTALPAPVTAGIAVNFTSTFTGCFSLQNVYFPSTCSGNATYNLTNVFSSCFNLKNIIFPTNLNASVFTNAFSACYNITSVTIQSPMPALTTLASTFNTCFLLNSVTLPTSVSASINLTSTFSGCAALKSITIPSGWTINNLSSTFINCTNLETVVLPNNAQNSLTTMASTFQSCVKLQSVVMPTSLNGLTTLLSTFNWCSSLISIIFPSTLNAVTTMATTFNGCSSLTSVTMPTSANAVNTFASIFTNCVSLETVTLPSTVGLVTTFAGTFAACASLKTVTLPTTQTSALTSIASIFAGCGILTTINNLDKLGSLTATPLVNATGFSTQTFTLESISFNCPFSILTLNGTSALIFNKLNSLRLLNVGAGQWTGSSPQINVSYSDLGVAALDQLFTDLTTITAKTINITGCTGAAGCTRSIATAKGWTVTG